GNAADISAPQVVSISPSDGVVGVLLNSLVRVEFSEPMAPSSINATTFLLQAGAVPVSGQVTFSGGINGPNTVATFTPDGFLAPATNFTVRVTTAVKDTEGNAL